MEWGGCLPDFPTRADKNLHDSGYWPDFGCHWSHGPAPAPGGGMPGMDIQDGKGWDRPNGPDVLERRGTGLATRHAGRSGGT